MVPDIFSSAHLAIAFAIATSSTTVVSTNDDEALLEREAPLDVIVRLALRRNPDIREASARTRAAEARIEASGRLPDLELKYEQWGVPLGKPWALDKAETLMIGLRQTFPAPGTLGARSRAASEDARVFAEGERTRAREIVAEARRAYAEYFRAENELRIHLEHLEIATSIVELARANYRAGKSTQSDVLRAIVELSRLHRDLSEIEQARTSARALLNTLLDRPPGAKLGPPRDLERTPSPAELAPLEQRLEANRPELVSAKHAIARSEAALEGAQRAASWPAFMVGADYWFNPTNDETPHAYGAMISMTLPWLNPRHDDDVREAEHALAADKSALRSIANTARYQLHDAIARFKAADDAFTIIDRDLLPQAEQSFDAARAGFAAGQADGLSVLDALRSLLDVRLEQVRARAALASIYADIERYSGAHHD